MSINYTASQLNSLAVSNPMQIISFSAVEWLTWANSAEAGHDFGSLSPEVIALLSARTLNGLVTNQAIKPLALMTQAQFSGWLGKTGWASIEATSSGNLDTTKLSRLTINGVTTLHSVDRGVGIAIVRPSGEVTFTTYDTWDLATHSTSLASYLNTQKDALDLGTQIVVMTYDEWTRHLTDNAKEALIAIGASAGKLYSLAYRSSYVMVTQKTSSGWQATSEQYQGASAAGPLTATVSSISTLSAAALNAMASSNALSSFTLANFKFWLSDKAAVGFTATSSGEHDVYKLSKLIINEEIPSFVSANFVGIQIVTVTLRGVMDIRVFNASKSPNELASYLNEQKDSLSLGTQLIVMTNFNWAQYLTDIAKSALIAIGASAGKLQSPAYRSSYLMVTQRTSNGWQATSEQYQGEGALRPLTVSMFSAIQQLSAATLNALAQNNALAGLTSAGFKSWLANRPLVSIEATSSGFLDSYKLSSLKVNGVVTPYNVPRGVGVAIVSPNGEVTFTTYDTWDSAPHSTSLANYLNAQKDALDLGTQIVVRTYDEWTRHLTDIAKQALVAIGASSDKLNSPAYRSSYLMVTQKTSSGWQATNEQYQEASAAGPLTASVSTISQLNAATLNALTDCNALGSFTSAKFSAWLSNRVSIEATSSGYADAVKRSRLTINGTDITTNADRGVSIAIISPNGDVTFTRYDTCGSLSKSYELATYLNAQKESLPIGAQIVVMTNDEWTYNLNVNAKEALFGIGASASTVNSAVFRSSYLMVTQKTGIGWRAISEQYQGASAAKPLMVSLPSEIRHLNAATLNVLAQNNALGGLTSAQFTDWLSIRASIEASSSGTLDANKQSRLTINGVITLHSVGRGVGVAIVRPSGEVTFTTYDTWASATDSTSLANYLNTQKDALDLGTQIVVMTYDEWTENLTDNAKKGLIAIGASADKLQSPAFRSSYLMVTQKTSSGWQATSEQYQGANAAGPLTVSASSDIQQLSAVTLNALANNNTLRGVTSAQLGSWLFNRPLVSIEATSSGFLDSYKLSSLKVNGVVTPYNVPRGVGVAIVSPNGEVTFTTYDTWDSAPHSTSLANYLNAQKDALDLGTQIVVRTYDEWTRHLTDIAKQALVAIGASSDKLNSPAYRSSYLMVTQKTSSGWQATNEQYQEASAAGPLTASVSTISQLSAVTLNALADCNALGSFTSAQLSAWLSNRVSIEATSIGFTDALKLSRLTINGTDITTNADRGVSIAIISPNGDVTFTSYDTCGSLSKSNELATYLNAQKASLPIGAQIVVMTNDEWTYSLTDNAKGALFGIGARAGNLDSPTLGSSYLMVTQKTGIGWRAISEQYQGASAAKPLMVSLPSEIRHLSAATLNVLARINNLGSFTPAELIDWIIHGSLSSICQLNAATLNALTDCNALGSLTSAQFSAWLSNRVSIEATSSGYADAVKHSRLTINGTDITTNAGRGVSIAIISPNGDVTFTRYDTCESLSKSNELVAYLNAQKASLPIGAQIVVMTNDEWTYSLTVNAKVALFGIGASASKVNSAVFRSSYLMVTQKTGIGWRAISEQYQGASAAKPLMVSLPSEIRHLNAATLNVLAQNNALGGLTSAQFTDWLSIRASIEASSSGTLDANKQSRLTINGVITLHSVGRGVGVAIVRPSGEVTFTTYDTWASAIDSTSLANYLNTQKDALDLGTQIVVMTYDEWTENLTDNAKKGLIAIGASADKLQSPAFRSSYLMVTQKTSSGWQATSEQYQGANAAGPLTVSASSDIQQLSAVTLNALANNNTLRGVTSAQLGSWLFNRPLVSIEATSSGFLDSYKLSSLKVNGVVTPYNVPRGVGVAIVRPSSAVTFKTFDTWESEANSSSLVTYLIDSLNSLQIGTQVVIMTSDEWTQHLTDNAKEALIAAGASAGKVSNPASRSSYLMVTQRTSEGWKVRSEQYQAPGAAGPLPVALPSDFSQLNVASFNALANSHALDQLSSSQWTDWLTSHHNQVHLLDPSALNLLGQQNEKGLGLINSQQLAHWLAVSGHGLQMLEPATLNGLALGSSLQLITPQQFNGWLVNYGTTPNTHLLSSLTATTINALPLTVRTQFTPNDWQSWTMTRLATDTVAHVLGNLSATALMGLRIDTLNRMANLTVDNTLSGTLLLSGINRIQFENWVRSNTEDFGLLSATTLNQLASNWQALGAENALTAVSSVLFDAWRTSKATNDTTLRNSLSQLNIATLNALVANTSNDLTNEQLNAWQIAGSPALSSVNGTFSIALASRFMQSNVFDPSQWENWLISQASNLRTANLETFLSARAAALGVSTSAVFQTLSANALNALATNDQEDGPLRNLDSMLLNAWLNKTGTTRQARLNSLNAVTLNKLASMDNTLAVISQSEFSAWKTQWLASAEHAIGDIGARLMNRWPQVLTPVQWVAWVNQSPAGASHKNRLADLSLDYFNISYSTLNNVVGATAPGQISVAAQLSREQLRKIINLNTSGSFYSINKSTLNAMAIGGVDGAVSEISASEFGNWLNFRGWRQELPYLDEFTLTALAVHPELSPEDSPIRKLWPEALNAWANGTTYTGGVGNGGWKNVPYQVLNALSADSLNGITSAQWREWGHQSGQKEWFTDLFNSFFRDPDDGTITGFPISGSPPPQPDINFLKFVLLSASALNSVNLIDAVGGGSWYPLRDMDDGTWSPDKFSGWAAVDGNDMSQVPISITRTFSPAFFNNLTPSTIGELTTDQWTHWLANGHNYGQLSAYVINQMSTTQWTAMSGDHWNAWLSLTGSEPQRFSSLSPHAFAHISVSALNSHPGALADVTLAQWMARSNVFANRLSGLTKSAVNALPADVLSHVTAEEWNGWLNSSNYLNQLDRFDALKPATLNALATLDANKLWHINDSQWNEWWASGHSFTELSAPVINFLNHFLLRARSAGDWTDWVNHDASHDMRALDASVLRAIDLETIAVLADNIASDRLAGRINPLEQMTGERWRLWSDGFSTKFLSIPATALNVMPRDALASHNFTSADWFSWLNGNAGSYTLDTSGLARPSPAPAGQSGLNQLTGELLSLNLASVLSGISSTYLTAERLTAWSLQPGHSLSQLGSALVNHLALDVSGSMNALVQNAVTAAQLSTEQWIAWLSAGESIPNHVAMSSATLANVAPAALKKLTITQWVNWRAYSGHSFDQLNAATVNALAESDSAEPSPTTPTLSLLYNQYASASTQRNEMRALLTSSTPSEFKQLSAVALACLSELTNIGIGSGGISLANLAAWASYADHQLSLLPLTMVNRFSAQNLNDLANLPYGADLVGQISVPQWQSWLRQGLTSGMTAAEQASTQAAQFQSLSADVIRAADFDFLAQVTTDLWTAWRNQQGTALNAVMASLIDNAALRLPAGLFNALPSNAFQNLTTSQLDALSITTLSAIELSKWSAWVAHNGNGTRKNLTPKVLLGMTATDAAQVAALLPVWLTNNSTSSTLLSKQQRLQQLDAVVLSTNLDTIKDTLGSENWAASLSGWAMVDSHSLGQLGSGFLSGSQSLSLSELQNLLSNNKLASQLRLDQWVALDQRLQTTYGIGSSNYAAFYNRSMLEAMDQDDLQLVSSAWANTSGSAQTNFSTLQTATWSATLINDMRSTSVPAVLPPAVLATWVGDTADLDADVLNGMSPAAYNFGSAHWTRWLAKSEHRLNQLSVEHLNNLSTHTHLAGYGEIGKALANLKPSDWSLIAHNSENGLADLSESIFNTFSPKFMDQLDPTAIGQFSVAQWRAWRLARGASLMDLSIETINALSAEVSNSFGSDSAFPANQWKTLARTQGLNHLSALIVGHFHAQNMNYMGGSDYDPSDYSTQFTPGQLYAWKILHANDSGSIADSGLNASLRTLIDNSVGNSFWTAHLAALSTMGSGAERIAWKKMIAGLEEPPWMQAMVTRYNEFRSQIANASDQATFTSALMSAGDGVSAGALMDMMNLLKVHYPDLTWSDIVNGLPAGNGDAMDALLTKLTTGVDNTDLGATLRSELKTLFQFVPPGIDRLTLLSALTYSNQSDSKPDIKASTSAEVHPSFDFNRTLLDLRILNGTFYENGTAQNTTFFSSFEGAMYWLTNRRWSDLTNIHLKIRPMTMLIVNEFTIRHLLNGYLKASAILHVLAASRTFLQDRVRTALFNRIVHPSRGTTPNELNSIVGTASHSNPTPDLPDLRSMAMAPLANTFRYIENMHRMVSVLGIFTVVMPSWLEYAYSSKSGTDRQALLLNSLGLTTSHLNMPFNYVLTSIAYNLEYGLSYASGVGFRTYFKQLTANLAYLWPASLRRLLLSPEYAVPGMPGTKPPISFRFGLFIGFLKLAPAFMNDFTQAVSSYYQYRTGIDKTTLLKDISDYEKNAGASQTVSNGLMAFADIMDMFPLQGNIGITRDVASLLLNLAPNVYNNILQTYSQISGVKKLLATGKIDNRIASKMLIGIYTRLSLTTTAIGGTIISWWILPNTRLDSIHLQQAVVSWSVAQPWIKTMGIVVCGGNFAVYAASESYQQLQINAARLNCTQDAEIFKAWEYSLITEAPLFNFFEVFGTWILTEAIEKANWHEATLQRMRILPTGATFSNPNPFDVTPLVQAMRGLYDTIHAYGYDLSIILASTQDYIFGNIATIKVAGAFEFDFNEVSQTLFLDENGVAWTGNVQSDTPWETVDNGSNAGLIYQNEQSGRGDILIKPQVVGKSAVVIARAGDYTGGIIYVDLRDLPKGTIILQMTNQVEYITTEEQLRSGEIYIYNQTELPVADQTPITSSEPSPGSNSTSAEAIKSLGVTLIPSRFIVTPNAPGAQSSGTSAWGIQVMNTSDGSAQGIQFNLDHYHLRDFQGNDIPSANIKVSGSTGNDIVYGATDFNHYSSGGGDDAVMLSGNQNTLNLSLGSKVLLTGRGNSVLVNADTISQQDGFFQSTNKDNSLDFGLTSINLNFFLSGTMIHINTSSADIQSIGTALATGFTVIGGGLGNDRFFIANSNGYEADVNILGSSGEDYYAVLNSQGVILTLGDDRNNVYIERSSRVFVQRKAMLQFDPFNSNAELDYEQAFSMIHLKNHSELIANLEGNNSVVADDGTSTLQLLLGKGHHELKINGDFALLNIDAQQNSVTRLVNDLDTSTRAELLYFNNIDAKRLAAKYDEPSKTLTVVSFDDAAHALAELTLRGNLDADTQIGYWSTLSNTDPNPGEQAISITLADKLIEDLASLAGSSSVFQNVTLANQSTQRMAVLGSLYPS